MPAHLTETVTGYAVYADGTLLLFDEDGALLGETEAGETLLDLTSLNGQAALLTHEDERRAKQAVLHTVESAGRVELPEAMAPYVERMDFIIGVPAKAHYNCGVVSWSGTMNVNFIRNVREPELESHFYRVLHRLGLPVKAESNQRR